MKLQLGLDRQTQYIEKLKAQFEAFKEAWVASTLEFDRIMQKTMCGENVNKVGTTSAVL